MLRSLILAALCIASASAAIWPEHLGKYERKSATPINISSDDRAQWDEYGLEIVEEADYGPFKINASRFKDTTGAYAASLEPLGRLGNRVGNYLVTCRGNCPKDYVQLAASALPHMSGAAVPTLGAHFPQKSLVSRSERYILGPIGLRQNTPRIPASAVAFDFGTEGEVARYRSSQGDQTLAIFAYPTPQMARQQAAVLERLPDVVVKRTGPLVALVLAPANHAAADQLLAQINYQASVSWDDQHMPLVIRPQTAAQMVLGIIALAGIVLGFCLLSGLAFGAFRVVARRFGYSDAGIAMTTLHLSDK